MVLIKSVKNVQEDLAFKMFTGLLQDGCWWQHSFCIYLNPHIKSESTTRQARPKTYNKIMWVDIPRNPQIQAMGQTNKNPKTSIQEKAIGSNGVSDGSENWKFPKQP